jgi:hypothetical protein
MANLPCYAYKYDPWLSWAAFAILKTYCSKGEKESVFLPFRILFLFIEEFFLVIKSVQGAYMALLSA